MALSNWPGAPAFAAGQAMSASAGLNWLARNVRMLHGVLLGPVTPFAGLFGSTAEGDYTTVASYWIRHRQDSLAWKFALAGGGDVHGKLVYGGQDVPGTDQNNAAHTYTEYTGTADLSGLTLTTGEFYTVEFKLKTTSGVGRGFAWKIVEQATTSFSLIDFADEVTPSTAEWNALSDATTAVMNVLDYPRAPQMGYHRDIWQGWGAMSASDYMWFGTMNHRCQYLTFSIGMNGPDVAHKTVWGTIYINGTARVTLANYRPGNLGTAITHSINGAPYTEIEPGEPNYTPVTGPHRFFASVDTSSWGLTVGVDYSIRVALTSDTSDSDSSPDLTVHYLFETPDATDALAGYTDPPVWAYGDWVKGDSGAKQVQLLHTDLDVLAAATVYQNRAAPWWDLDLVDAWLWNMRLNRWLHYTNVEDDPAAIRWHDGQEWKETSLPDAKGLRLVADLNAYAGLWPGTRYQLNRATWAVEDSNI